MAPRDGMVVVAPAPRSESTSTTSLFWNRLNTLPVFQSTLQTTKGIYDSSKERAYIGKGLGVLEYGFNLASGIASSTPVKKVVSTVADKVPVATTTVVMLDSMACNCLETIENKIPAIQKAPTQIVTDVKKGTTGAIHSGVRKVMKTYPGQKVVNSLDYMINWSESTLDRYEVVDEESEQGRGAVITVKLRNGAVVPLKVYLQMLRMVKHMLANMAGVKTRLPSCSSPMKAKPDLQKRKRVSPKKRLPKRSLVSSAMSLLGLGSSTQEDVARSLHEAGSGSPTEPLGSCAKRKFEAEDSSDSEAESMNLASALDTYDSELDSDYNPEEEVEADESLEYNSGDTESDLEPEDAGTNKKGKLLKQLKEKTGAKPVIATKPVVVPPTESQPPTENQPPTDQTQT